MPCARVDCPRDQWVLVSENTKKATIWVIQGGSSIRYKQTFVRNNEPEPSDDMTAVEISDGKCVIESATMMDVYVKAYLNDGAVRVDT